MSSFKEYKDSQFDEKVRVTASEFRQNTCNLMTYQLCEYFEAKNLSVDCDMKNLINTMFEYILIKRRDRANTAINLIKDGKSTIEREVEEFVHESWNYLNKGKEFYTRKQYLNWVHHKFSCGITRKQLVEYMWKMAMTNKKVIECIINLRDVRKYLN